MYRLFWAQFPVHIHAVLVLILCVDFHECLSYVCALLSSGISDYAEIVEEDADYSTPDGKFDFLRILLSL